MKLYNHQEAAISAAVEYLIEDDNDKGIISMCPRSGKSLVAQQIQGSSSMCRTTGWCCASDRSTHGFSS